MKKPKTITLSPTESIVAVVPEHCSGPGWQNAVVWVHIVDRATSRHREEAIQPGERTDDMHALFEVGATAHKALLRAVPVNRNNSPR